MNGWRATSWRQSWGSSWGTAVALALKRVRRILKMPARLIPFPLFKK